MDPIVPPRVGKMANTFLGMMMLLFVAIGLFCFDGFLGFSYLASFFVKGVMPYDLYEEAYSAFHKKLGLSGANVDGVPPKSSTMRWRFSSDQGNSTSKSFRLGNVDEEIAALLGSKRRVEVELASHPSM